MTNTYHFPVRSSDDELRHRLMLRKKYLEDPDYRRWSDLAPGGIDGLAYKDYRDDVLFDYFITNQVTHHSHALDLVYHLEDGLKLPINWSNFYAYFDERLNDQQNRYLKSITDNYIRGNGREPETSIKELLNRYRGTLVKDYDMI